MRPIFQATPLDAMSLHLEVNDCCNHIKIEPLRPCEPVVRFCSMAAERLRGKGCVYMPIIYST